MWVTLSAPDRFDFAQLLVWIARLLHDEFGSAARQKLWLRFSTVLDLHQLYPYNESERLHFASN